MHRNCVRVDAHADRSPTAVAAWRKSGLERLESSIGTTVSTSGFKPSRKEQPVLRQVAEGVLIHESEFLQSNAAVVQGRAGVLLIDPGVHDGEMAALANDLRELGQPV